MKSSFKKKDILLTVKVMALWRMSHELKKVGTVYALVLVNTKVAQFVFEIGGAFR
jgi:hypothetical protein